VAYFEWNASLSVGIARIDEQHKHLVNCINLLHQAFIDKKGPELQAEIISEMCDYAAHHFALEEELMAKSAFPGLAVHREEHAQFAREAADLKARSDSGALILTIVLLSFLKNWLKNHILGTDMKYVTHFKRHGLN
jgi:hemerythrin